LVSQIRNKSLTLAAIGTILAVSMSGLPSHAATSGTAPQAHPPTARGDQAPRTPGNYDARDLTGTALAKSERRQVLERTRSDKAYYRSLGGQAVVDMDPLTHTVRDLGRLDGYLTGPSSSSPRTIALGYVRSHLGALGLRKGDLRTLRFRQDYVDPLGLHHLSWTQSARGTTVFGNGLKVAVTRYGQVLQVQGSPVSGLRRLAAAAPAATRLSPSAARSKAAANVDGRLQHLTPGYAGRVWFLTAAGLRPGWSTYVQTTNGSYQHVIDASSGRILYRHSTTNDANGDALVYDNFPGAARGGKAKVVNFVERGWLKKRATFLKGSSVTAFSDLNDDNRIESREKTPVPGTRHGAQFKLHKFGRAASGLCARWVCTWKPKKTRSWKTNRRADVTNAFYLASNFHDYLARKPIDFTSRAGNFSRAGGDPVLLNALDGAATGPDENHLDNANMSTPPDGISPTMQMYLWGPDPATGERFVPTSGAFDASILYHEYTHGLSNRLVVDVNGNSTLNDIQAGAMGEAWSDYYAMDYLVTRGFLKDTKKPGQLLEGRYVSAGKHLVRTMAMDCPVGAKAKGCRSGFDPHVRGGYTYGDFPSIVGEPEVHGSGEIWGQTLWDLRTKLGHRVTDTLVTRAMSLSVADPDFLDMRDAILQADLVAYNAKHQRTIWKVFAHRGMGFFAGSIDSGDIAPAQDFHVRPAHSRHDGTIAGFVTDPRSGDPVQGALVQVTGQSARVTTGPDGFYEIDNLVPGRYRKIVATAPGYLSRAHAGRAVRIRDFTGADLTDFTINRDWTAVSGGAQVVAFDGPDYTPDCGPVGALDTSLATGWGSVTGHENSHQVPVPTNVFEPKSLIVRLPRAVDIDLFKVDPTATCGDGGSASTGKFLIETSPNGSSWTPAASGEFTTDDQGHLNDVSLTGGQTNVQYVRFTIQGNQVPNFSKNCPNGPFDGCTFTDLTELVVLGTAH
jgi:hypothetical protein